MARYRLAFKQSVTKDLRPIPKQDIARILARVEALAADPRPQGCEKLSGKERYRVRQGVYRIVYEIDDDEAVIAIIKVAHRREVYRR